MFADTLPARPYRLAALSAGPDRQFEEGRTAGVGVSRHSLHPNRNGDLLSAGEAPSGLGISADWPPALTSPPLTIVIRGQPILATMPDTQNDDLVLISHIINHQMGLVGMHADRRRDLLSQARGMGIVSEKCEYRAQPFMIASACGKPNCPMPSRNMAVRSSAAARVKRKLGTFRLVSQPG